MSLMNSITYTPRMRSVRIMGGAKWGDVYRALQPYRIAVTGGRADTVGVAGLIIGGQWLYSHPAGMDG
jgi:hypothetical protein